jgi:rod shape-determining protein MreC
MSKRPHYLALGVVLFLTFLLLKLPSRTAANLKLSVSGMFLPLFGLASSTEDLVNNSSYATVPRYLLIEKIDGLEKEKQESRIRLMQADEALKANARLREQACIARQYRWKMQPARVASRDPANWWRTLKIDVGSRDGIVTNAAVVTPQGLVGRVAEVGFAQSQVVLVGDPDCRVSVLISETREQGMIAPVSSSPLDDTLVELSYLSRNSKLAVGQTVVTSGLGGVFPKGIVVGQIADFRTMGYGLYKEARVSLAVKMNVLEEVWVIKP